MPMIWFIQDHKNFHKKCIVQFGVNQHYLFKNTIATLLFISKRGANSILVHNPTPIYSCLVTRHHWLQARTRALVCWAPPALPQVTNTVRKALKIYTACYAILANFVPPTNAWVFLMSCMCKDIRRGSIAGGNGVRDLNLYTRVMSIFCSPGICWNDLTALTSQSHSSKGQSSSRMSDNLWSN